MEVSLPLLILGGIGMTVIVVESTLFSKIKDWAKKNFGEIPVIKYPVNFFLSIANCHQCCGWWSGAFLSFFFYTPCWMGVDTADCLVNLLQNLGRNFASGCAVSLLSVFWAAIMMFIESKTMIQS
jgi:hypothetical protein